MALVCWNQNLWASTLDSMIDQKKLHPWRRTTPELWVELGLPSICRMHLCSTQQAPRYRRVLTELKSITWYDNRKKSTGIENIGRKVAEVMSHCSVSWIGKGLIDIQTSGSRAIKSWWTQGSDIIGIVKGRVGRKMKVLEWCDFRVKCFQMMTVCVFLIQGSKSVMRKKEWPSCQ